MEKIFFKMKNWLLIIVFFGCGFYALWEQSKPEPNKFLMIFCVAIFMIGLYRLMKKIPSKEEENEE